MFVIESVARSHAVLQAPDRAGGAVRFDLMAQDSELELASGGGADLRASFEADVDLGSGAPRVRIPLALPAGQRRLGPALSLVLGDDGLGGVFGFGVSLEGLPFVGVDERDGVARYDGTDRFAWAGQELVPNGASARGGDEFRVELFGTREQAEPVVIERWIPRSDQSAHFRVRQPDGTVDVYGASSQSRIADSRGDRVWRFLLDARYDGHGNAMLVRYAADGAMRYPERIVYGNRAPMLEGEREGTFHIEVAFHYGDEERIDPFVTGRPGFRVAVRRLCRRIDVFLHIDQGSRLLHSIELEHAGDPTGARLRRIRVFGVSEDGGRVEEPGVELRYNAFELGAAWDEVELDAGPAFGPNSRLIDLFSEGLPGILTDSGYGLYYAKNLGNGIFGARELLAQRPRGIERLELMDFDGDGNIEAVALTGSQAGYYRLDRHVRGWEPFRPLASTVRADPRRIEHVDLTGSGRADLVLLDANGFTWFPSRGIFGVGDGMRVHVDAERAPRSDVALCRFLADMTGDGLVDLVEVRNGSVEYWPSLGRGRFGDRIAMLDAPRLDYQEMFDASRVRLFDLDGSGTADLLYFEAGELHVYRNARGERFLERQKLEYLPPSRDLFSAQVVDIFDEGTPCLVWADRMMQKLRAIRLLPGGPPGRLMEIVEGPPWAE